MSDEDDARRLEYEQHLTREEVADYLEAVVDGLRGGESIDLTIGGESAEISPGEHIEFEVEYEKYGDERELEFELEWTEQGGELEISDD